MFVVISQFTVSNINNMSEAVKNAFKERPHLVENTAGFVRMDVLSPVENSDEIWLLTYWTDQDSFQAWYGSPHYKESHLAMPAGLKLIPDKTQMLFLNHIAS